MADNSLVAEILLSRELTPFWDEVKRLRDSQMKILMNEECVNRIPAIKVIDQILNLPSQFSDKGRKK